MYLDQCLDSPQLPVVQSQILRQFDGRLKPELHLPVCAVGVDMHPQFLAGEEVEAESTFAKNRWTHQSQSVRL